MTRNVTRIWLALVLGIALASTAGQIAWAGEANKSSSSNTALQATTTQIATAASVKNTTPSIRYCTRTLNQSRGAWVHDGATTGAEGNALGLIEAAFELSGTPKGSVQYQVHVADVGWLAAASDGTFTAPPAGINRSIDAVRIMLTGTISKTYSVSYRAKMQGAKDWQAWKTDGAKAGAAGKGVGVQALQVELVKKDEATDAGMGIIGVCYRTNVQQLGWSQWATGNAAVGKTGKKLRLMGLQMTLNAGAYKNSGIEYRVHIQGGSWSNWKSNGASTGSSGKINGIQVRLTGDIANDYDVVYRAYVQDIGWQRRMRNGTATETAGVANKALRIEALRVNLVPKSNRSGWIKGKNGWSFYQAGQVTKSSWLTTSEHPIATALAGKQRYWVDSKGILATKRYVDPNEKIDKKAGYTAYATTSGYVARGKFTNSDGLLLANNSTGQLITTTRWLETSAFDGSKQKYRLVKKGPATVVKTGLFKVSGKYYYGWPGKRGYLMRSNLQYINNKWYEADAEGVVTVGGGANAKAIERYVRWAVKIAKNDSHGYSQANRWGPDYDCSSLVCAAIKAAGFPDSGATYTGNMRYCLTRIGFVWHSGTSGIRRGDIMLVHHTSGDWNQHTEIYLGDGKLVGAHYSENGGIDGQPGDQTGHEISVGSYYNMPWDGYLRYLG